MNPALVLRLEGLLVLALAVLAYGRMLHGSWWLFACLFLVPDISLLPFALPGGIAAKIQFYNLLHTYVLPCVLLALGMLTGAHLYLVLGVIWIAHIALDRLFGYGLKLGAFRYTHIQAAASTPPAEPLG